MEKKKDLNMRITKVMFNSDGKGGVTPKISIPISWLRDMGIDTEEREIKLSYDEKTKSFTAIKNSN